jgi:Tho complex subunit 7
MAGFTLLDQAEEGGSSLLSFVDVHRRRLDKLHAARLLQVEDRPFKNLIRRLLGPDTPYQKFLARPHADEAHDGTDLNGHAEESQDKFLTDLQNFREIIIYQFTAFESSIARLQFLRAANNKERERYATEKLKIEATAEEVRDNTAKLRIQLDEAQKTLAIRKTYDVLAEKITKNAALKPRDEQHVNIEKLKAEIEELERESHELSQTWIDRREQVSKVVDEAARLRRQIRNEKEPEEVEAEKRAQEMLDIDREREAGSHIGTPRPDEDAQTPGQHSREMTPIPEGDARTPLPEGKGSGVGTPGPDVDMSDQAGETQRNGEASVKVTVTDEKGVDEMDTT